jgi:hypothetical protein
MIIQSGRARRAIRIKVVSEMEAGEQDIFRKERKFSSACGRKSNSRATCGWPSDQDILSMELRDALLAGWRAGVDLVPKRKEESETESEQGVYA